jgi:hypothetical protein
MKGEIFLTDGAPGYLEYAGDALSRVGYSSVERCRRLEVRETRNGFEIHEVRFSRALDSQEWHERARRKRQTYQNRLEAIEAVKVYERGYWEAVAEDLEDQLDRVRTERELEHQSSSLPKVMTQQKQTTRDMEISL